MGKSKQIRNHNSDKKKSISKLWKTKRRTKDLDQIHLDMSPENARRLLNQEVDFDMVGNAQHYCLHCAVLAGRYIQRSERLYYLYRSTSEQENCVQCIQFQAQGGVGKATSL